MMNSDIPAKNRQRIAAALARLLADEILLQMKLRNAHWNVTGPDFVPVHRFLEEQYTMLNGAIDEIAERIRMLGQVAPGSFAELLKLGRLKELPGGERTSSTFLKLILSDHETLISQLRKDADEAAAAGDPGTNDYLIGLLQEHEKLAWMVRATLR